MELKTKPCTQCGREAREVIHAESHTRKGWYCPYCKHYDLAVGRERKL